MAMGVDVLRALSSMGCAPITEEDVMGLPGRLLATYPLLPTFKFSEKLDCYVDRLEELDPNIPGPHPPPNKKADIFDVSEYSDVDARAVNTPYKFHKSTLKELVDYLTFGYDDDMCKLRVIYRWITCQPIDRLTIAKEPQQNQAIFQLWRIKNKKGNYAQLVSLLCRYASIPCIIIHGTLKGSTYEVGDKIDEDKHYGEWNAVLIDRHWRFVNAYWGTCAEGAGNEVPNGVSETDEMSTGRLYYCCDENYFLTDPDQVVATHLPHLPKWQLKKDAVVMEEFEKMTFVKDRYFNLHLRTLSHRECIIRSDTGEVDITFRVPRHLSPNIDFQYLLFKLEDDKEQRIDRYVFLQSTNNHETLSIKIRYPEPCNLRFELVGKDVTIRDPNYDYDWIAIYKIVFSGGLKACVPFPPPPTVGWGPGRIAMETGIVPLSHFSGEIQMDDYGRAEVRFGAADKAKIGELMYAAVLYTGGEKMAELPDQVVHRVENGDIIFNAMAPSAGEYVLRLFVRREDEQGNGREFCDYLLTSKQKEKNGRFPKGFSHRLGPRVPAFALSGLFPSRPSGFISTDLSEVQLGFKRSEDIELSVNFSGEKLKPAEAPLLLSQVEKTSDVTYTVRLPEPGQYGLKVQGTRLDGGLHEPIYDYVIDYRKVKKRTKNEPTIKQEAETFDSTEPESNIDNDDIDQIIDDIIEDTDGDNLETIVLPETETPETKPDILRRRVRMAVEEKNADEMSRAISDMRNLKLPSILPDITYAEKELDSMKLRKDLIIAIRNKDFNKLKLAVKKVEKAGAVDQMEHEVKVAKQLIQRLKKLQRLLHAILALDQSTIAEIRSYSTPPPIVHTVMMATLLLLGHWQEETRKWKLVQTLLGKTGKESLKRLISDFKIEKCPLEVAMGAKDFIRDHSIEQVRLVSAGCATFYVWVKGVIEELEKRCGDEINNVRPKTSKGKKKHRRELTFLGDLE